MDWTDVISLINDEKWEQARRETDKLKAHLTFHDTAALIEAAICENEHDEMGTYECIAAGLKYNCRNYELYVMLGNYYYRKNVSQAYLCYENAEFHCKPGKDKEHIRQCMKGIKQQYENLTPPPISIVIVSYNNSEMMKNCIQSIRDTTPPSAYELVVTDNASDDGVAEWLGQQNDAILIRNNENRGFGYGCNQGVKASKPDNDIFFLNNDTLLPPNAIFWLRMGLYENQQTGATGSISNFVGNGQQAAECYDSVQAYMEYGEKNNVPVRNPYERKVWLSGFALLIKRRALDEIGLFDLRYGKGLFEDDDIGVRLRYAGYHLLLCRNSFIFHYGSQSFNKNRNDAIQLSTKNRQIFQEKWGFDMERYTYPQTAILDFIEEEKESPIRVLEIGCGAGMLLSKIKYRHPNSTVRGIETKEEVAQLGKDYLGVEWGNAETMTFSYEKDFFDYIIFSNVLETFYSPEETIERLKPYLKKEGKMLFSIYNAAHACVLSSLLDGTFAYSAMNICHKEHIRFFGIGDIAQMIARCGLIAEDCRGMEKVELIEALPRGQMETLCHIFTENDNLLRIFQYFIKAGKSNC